MKNERLTLEDMEQKYPDEWLFRHVVPNRAGAKCPINSGIINEV